MMASSLKSAGSISPIASHLIVSGSTILELRRFTVKIGQKLLLLTPRATSCALAIDIETAG
jgi:hypothetical protein